MAKVFAVVKNDKYVTWFYNLVAAEAVFGALGGEADGFTLEKIDEETALLLDCEEQRLEK